MNEVLREELTQVLGNLIDVIDRIQTENLNEVIAAMQQQSPEDNTTFTPDEVAEYLSCSIGTAYKYIQQKEIPSFKIGPRIFVYKRELDTWIAKGGSAAEAVQ